MAAFTADYATAGPAIHIPNRYAATLTAGLEQRAQLAALIVRDLTGPANLISEGILPPDVISSTLGWSTPLASRETADDDNILLTSLEIVRNADHSWTVLADRTSVPYGVGILSGVVLGEPFERFRSILRGEIARRSGGGNVVVLFDPDAPGLDENMPASRRLQDAVQFAEIMGLTLATPAELRVYDGSLWHLPLHGTQDAPHPVGLVIRYVPVRALDPLEPRALGTAGVPGLAGLVRTGKIRIINPPAAVVYNNPALATFLPRIAAHFLKEDLILQPVTTYWCGDREMCSHTIAGVSRLVTRSISRPEIYDGRKLNLKECAELCARISDEPWDWVGQEPVEPDVVELPDGSISPVMLRGYAAGSQDAWHALSGGLAFIGELDDRERILAPVEFDGGDA